MEKLVVGIVVTIILMSLAFFIMNDRIGPGLDQGGDNLQQKIIEATAP
ncbi:hypothetical protein [Brevibacillus agri]|nr:hypothetical protein [Brevibacillus agri]